MNDRRCHRAAVDEVGFVRGLKLKHISEGHRTVLTLDQARSRRCSDVGMYNVLTRDAVRPTDRAGRPLCPSIWLSRESVHETLGGFNQGARPP